MLSYREQGRTILSARQERRQTIIFSVGVGDGQRTARHAMTQSQKFKEKIIDTDYWMGATHSCHRRIQGGVAARTHPFIRQFIDFDMLFFLPGEKTSYIVRAPPPSRLEISGSASACQCPSRHFTKSISLFNMRLQISCLHVGGSWFWLAHEHCNAGDQYVTARKGQQVC